MSGKKKLIIGGSVATVVIAAVAVILFLLAGKEETYRVIKVLEVDGSVAVERQGVGEIQAYAGMTLQSGDKISVASNSMLVLQMDDDKYAYVEEDSILTMVAEGNSRDSKTGIRLERGAITCHIEEKLSDSSSYEVQTQNSVMAVRGTVFRVGIYEPDASGIDTEEPVVQVSVYDGEVLVTLIHPDGTMGESASVFAGECAAVGSDSTNSFFLKDADLEKLPVPEESRQVLKALQDILKREPGLSITEEELEAFLEEADAKTVYDVYFYANGKLFGVQQVPSGQTATRPGLSPGASGDWNLDFGKPITDDTDVYWLE